MNYASICSGIEAASVAWQPLGWKPLWLSEIDPFANAILKHHYPSVINHGDFTKITDPGKPDLIIGGTPCQSFSMSGCRTGLDDPRGQLALGFTDLIARCNPRWVVWENVPGVLTSSNGHDFREFISSLVQLGYGVCWRILDSQYFGVAQCRRRVFLVGYRGDWRRAAAVLFESPGGDHASHVRLHQDATRLHDDDPEGKPVAHRISTRNKYERRYSVWRVNQSNTISTRGSWSGNQSATVFLDCNGIRKLTVLEIERVMGFPDDFTNIIYKGKPAPVGPRIKALGNSIVVPVLRWLGERIDLVDKIETSNRTNEA